MKQNSENVSQVTAGYLDFNNADVTQLVCVVMSNSMPVVILNYCMLLHCHPESNILVIKHFQRGKNKPTYDQSVINLQLTLNSR